MPSRQTDTLGGFRLNLVASSARSWRNRCDARALRLRHWPEIKERLVREIRRSERLTGEDLAVRTNPIDAFLHPQDPRRFGLPARHDVELTQIGMAVVGITATVEALRAEAQRRVVGEEEEEEEEERG